MRIGENFVDYIVELESILNYLLGSINKHNEKITVCDSDNEDLAPDDSDDWFVLVAWYRGYEGHCVLHKRHDMSAGFNYVLGSLFDASGFTDVAQLALGPRGSDYEVDQ